MAIKSNVGIPLVSIGIGDTTVLSPTVPNDRVAVTACSLHNTTGSAITVTVWESPNLTSASGNEIAVYDLGSEDSADIEEIIGQGYAVGRNIIARGSAWGVVAVTTVTEYTNGS